MLLLRDQELRKTRSLIAHFAYNFKQFFNFSNKNILKY